MGKRKKSVSRTKSTGRKRSPPRKDSKATRKNIQKSDAAKGRHMTAHKAAESTILSDAQELEGLGNDPSIAMDIMSKYHEGKYHEAANIMEGYAESFMDPSVEQMIMKSSAVLHQLEHTRPHGYMPSVENKGSATSFYAFKPDGVWYEVFKTVEGSVMGMFRTTDETEAMNYYRKNKDMGGIQKMSGSLTAGLVEVEPGYIPVKGVMYKKAYHGPHTKEFADSVVKSLADENGIKAVAKRTDRGWLIYTEPDARIV